MLFFFLLGFFFFLEDLQIDTHSVIGLKFRRVNFIPRS